MASLRHILNPLGKVPYLYVDNIEAPFCERGMERAVHFEDSDSPNADLSRIFEATAGMNFEQMREWILENRSLFSPDTCILEDESFEAVTPEKSLIVCLQPFNTIRRFNVFLSKANELLRFGGTLALFGETSGMRRKRIESGWPRFLGVTFAVVDYFFTRVLVKLTLTRKLALNLSRGHNRNYPRVEVLGRIARAGFSICGDEMRGDVFAVSAVRTGEPVKRKPHYGIFIRLPRKGKDGKPIGVYKLRTMYAYSEYIQDYAYKINGLEDGGKLKDDFRVNTLGSFFRKRFLDELPMLINFFSGDLKLVGVRPLSRQYLSLYTPEMQALHLSVKPGIFPPLYYDFPKPVTIEDVQDSERRYIESYLEHPFRTDWVYFWGMVRNIIFRRERSH